MYAATERGPIRDPAWRGRLTATIVAVALLWPLASISEFKPWLLFDTQSMSAARVFLGGFLPPRLDSDFLLFALRATWVTVAIATAGMSLAVAGAIPLSLLVMSRLSLSSIGRRGMDRLPYLLRQAIRSVLVGARSLPEVVVALLFVRVVGLGPSAGVWAIAITYCAMLAKVLAEIVDSSDGSAAEALLHNGAGRLGAFLYGTLPQCATELVSYLIYRWECAIRASVVMGFVGAGGLGQQIDASVKMMAGNEVATMLILFILLVGLADLVSTHARRWLG